MVTLTEPERHLLERLAAEGKATRLALGELEVAKSLERDGLVFMIRDTLDAIITPKGRHLLAGIEIGARPGKEIGGGPAKKPFGFMD
jgi:hypothetical protein